MKSLPIGNLPERPKKRIFLPSDFETVIREIPEECALIGGQAVAWWAQQYGSSEKPITSCDIDFWGFREHLELLARALGRKPLLPHKYEMTAWVGAIPMTLKGEKTLVEFIHTLPGIDVFNPEKASVRQVFHSGRLQKNLLVLSPVSLVLTKLHALRAFEQTERQDELHLRVSLVTSNSFITQLLKEGNVKQVLWNIERLIAASENKPYQRLESDFGFQVLSVIPAEAIEKAVVGGLLPNPDRHRLEQFLTIRWPQVQRRSKSK